MEMCLECGGEDMRKLGRTEYTHTYIYKTQLKLGKSE